MQAPTKRTTFPQVNSKIVAVAELGSLDLLLSTVKEYLPVMNLVNMSTALHRLAKLTAYDGHSQARLRDHPVLAKLLAAAHATMMKSLVGNSLASCQALSNIVWAMATIKYVDVPLLLVAGEIAHRRASEFKPFEMSSMLWAFARFDHAMPEPKWMIAKLFERSAKEISFRTEQFSFRCLVMVAWAFINVRRGDSGLFLSLVEAMMPSLPDARPVEIVKVAWVLSFAGIQQDSMLRQLASAAKKRLGHFKAYELSKLLCYFMNHNFFDEAFLLSAAHALQAMTLKANQVATLLVALMRTMPRSPSTKAALMMLLPKFSMSLGDMRQDEFVQVACAAAICICNEQGIEQLLTENQGEEEHIESAQEELTEFVVALQLQACVHLPTVSDNALADLAQAFSVVHIGWYSQLLEEIAQEAARRISDISTQELLVISRSLSASGAASCHIAVQPLFQEIACRVKGMRTQGKRDLSHTHVNSQVPQRVPNETLLEQLENRYHASNPDWLEPPPGLSTMLPRTLENLRNSTRSWGAGRETFNEADAEMFEEFTPSAGQRQVPNRVRYLGEPCAARWSV